MLRTAALGIGLAAACGSSEHARDAAIADSIGDVNGDGATGCVDVGMASAVPVGVAPAADEHGLKLRAKAASRTRWDEIGNEAVVLDVLGAGDRLIGHLVLHQGADEFDYTMHVGALAAGEAISVRVSALSATNAVRSACVHPATLISAASLGDAEGMVKAPEFRWPVQKRFNDIPIVVGWSKIRQGYQTLFTNEDGGTVKICGDGADGIQAEVARWGRAFDIEGDYSVGGASPTWQRCTGTVPFTTTSPRLLAAHPIFYYGDGHNRLFESRGGYGAACGSAAPEKSNGDIAGWNTNNPGNELALDEGRVIILRPLPVDLDVTGYGQFIGRREALADVHAPWIYALTAQELVRENRIDNVKALPVSRYLYVDVRVADVNGTGDEYCAASVTGGFKVRAFTTDNVQIDGPQMTAPYVGATHNYKRVAIPLPDGVGANEIDHFVFDAFEGDGIYLTAFGDAFIATGDGASGIPLAYVKTGETSYSYYVDDDSTGCAGGVNSDGPGGVAYTCAGTLVVIPK